LEWGLPIRGGVCAISKQHRAACLAACCCVRAACRAQLAACLRGHWATLRPRCRPSFQLPLLARRHHRTESSRPRSGHLRPAVAAKPKCGGSVKVRREGGIQREGRLAEARCREERHPVARFKLRRHGHGEKQERSRSLRGAPRSRIVRLSTAPLCDGPEGCGPTSETRPRRHIL
jgi:hypothetical protein